MRSLPAGACDAHCHVFGPAARFPFVPERTYTPEDAPAAALMALHRALGIMHAVLVQPACYGADHRAMLNAIALSAGRYRGVALLPDHADSAEVTRLDAAGICGVRFNFVAHLGPSPSPDHIRHVAQLVAPFGWHLALHARVADLPDLRSMLEDLPVPFVVDHLARIDLRAGLKPDDLRALLDVLSLPRAWLKLSGADRASTGPPYAEAQPLLEALIEARPDRLLWGTDWPHPNIAGPIPEERNLLALLQRSARNEHELRQILIDNPRTLFRFDQQETSTPHG
jgi:predicted TIM-barrel fold metal-dependent hydrolase